MAQVSSDLLMEAQLWSTYKALLGAGKLKLVAAATAADTPAALTRVVALGVGDFPLEEQLCHLREHLPFWNWGLCCQQLRQALRLSPLRWQRWQARSLQQLLQLKWQQGLLKGQVSLFLPEVCTK